MFRNLAESIMSRGISKSVGWRAMALIAGFGAVAGTVQADTHVSTNGIGPAVKRFDADVEEWFYTLPTPADIITWKSGTNWADRSRYTHHDRTETKFDFEDDDPVAKTLAGFMDMDGPGIYGSTAQSAGGGFSEFVPGRLWAIPTCHWHSAVGGSLGDSQKAYWSARSQGLDPFYIHPALLDEAGITESVFDLFVAGGFEAGTELGLNGRMDLDIWYDTADESVHLFRLVADADTVSLYAPDLPGLGFVLLDAIEDGPDAIEDNTITLDELKTLMESDIFPDRTLDAPLYIGVVWEDIPVPTVDLGNGAVAGCRIENEAKDRDARFGNPFHRIPWLDDFDHYEGGLGLINQSPWTGFNDNPDFDGIVNPMLAFSPPDCIDVQPFTNLVHPFEEVDEGTLHFHTMMLIPPDYQSGGNDPMAGQHLMIFDDYEVNGPVHLGALLQFDSNDQMLKCYCGDQNNPVMAPYIVDQWVPIDVMVDLENDYTQVFYDNQPICEYTWTAGAFGDNQGTLEIAGITLFGRESSSVFYDDFVLETMEEPCAADVNGDGEVDIDDLFQVLGMWGACDACPEDVTQDGLVDIDDVFEVLGNWGACG